MTFFKARTSSLSSFLVPLLLAVGGLMMAGCGATAPVINSINTPDTLETEEDGRFRAAIENEEEADEPITYTWVFGDGETAAGIQARHSYSSTGTYNVRFRAENEGGADTSRASVTVIPQPQPPQVTSVNASPNPVDEDEPVRFRANVQGDTPMTYRWRFGDGAQASAQSPSHTYDEPGQYTARLTASNDVGERTRTVSVRVNRVLPEVCTTVNELNAAFFEQNSSTLTDEARSSLSENADVLSQCPNLQVRIEGFAAPSERNTQALSGDRAEVVSSFYRDNDVPGSRIMTRSRGEVEDATSKMKGEQRQYRRADSIPQRQGGN